MLIFSLLANIFLNKICMDDLEQVTTVDMQKPPPDFRTNFEATHPPILIDNGLAILENDKIERHIMKSIPGGYNLFVQVSRVDQTIAAAKVAGAI